MWKRAGYSDRSRFIIEKELKDLVMVESGYICCITGRRVYIHDKRRNMGVAPYWAAAIDHRKPLNKGQRNDPSLWAKLNMQVMSHVLNYVKGDNWDDDVREWLDNYMRRR